MGGSGGTPQSRVRGSGSVGSWSAISSTSQTRQGGCWCVHGHKRFAYRIADQALRHFMVTDRSPATTG